jgi:hypothetical protein
MNARLGRAADRAALLATARETAFYGRAVVAPTMGITLLAGFAMLGVAHYPIRTPWVLWGLAALGAFVVVGALGAGRFGAELARIMSAPSPDANRVRILQARLFALSLVNVAILLSAIWAMVAKPTF